MMCKCAGRKENGQLCRATPLKDGESCLMHSPEHAIKAAEARPLGGLRRRREVAVSGSYDFSGWRRWPTSGAGWRWWYWTRCGKKGLAPTAITIAAGDTVNR